MGELPITDPNGGEPPNVWPHVRPYLPGLVHVGQQSSDGTPSLDDYGARVGVHDMRAPLGCCSVVPDAMHRCSQA